MNNSSEKSLFSRLSLLFAGLTFFAIPFVFGIIGIILGLIGLIKQEEQKNIAILGIIICIFKIIVPFSVL